MTAIELTKSGIAMQKFRSDPQNALNERRKDVLRYVEKRGSFPIAQNWKEYGFTVAEIVEKREEANKKRGLFHACEMRVLLKHKSTWCVLLLLFLHKLLKFAVL